MNKLIAFIQKLTGCVNALSEKLKTTSIDRFYESMLSEDEYLYKGKVVRAIQHTKPFECNSGINCPWTEEMKEFGYRQKCLKCGKLSHGSGQ